MALSCSSDRDFGDDDSAGGSSGAGRGGNAATGASGGASGAGAAGGAGASDSGAGGMSGGGAGVAGAAGMAGAPGDCQPGTTRACSEAGLLGPCGEGSQVCTPDASWSACSVLPAEADGCTPDDDADCNGIANEGCPCVANSTRSCEEAGALGSCSTGSQACTTEGVWGSCSIEPSASDACTPGNDDNCNGVPNEGCTCVEGMTRSCSAAGLVGKCAAGTQTCTAQGSWGACSIAASAADTCDEGNNDNCAGPPNEGCLCINNVTTRACGACNDGTQVCINGKSNQYGTCTGATRMPVTYYRDADGDGYGTTVTTTACDGRPAGYADRSGDCCDDGGNLMLAAEIFPGQPDWFNEAANICGIAWNYDCSPATTASPNGVQTNPATRGSGCTSPYPTCGSGTEPLTEANCGKTTASCGCAAIGVSQSCTGGCSGAFVVTCH
jgi:hypothetical protein